MATTQSRMMLRSEISSGGSIDVISTTFSDVNSSLSGSDFVDVGNAFGSLCRYEVTTIRRIDVIDYSPDEFEG